MLSKKFSLLLTSLFLLSCGDTVRNKKKGKNRMINGIQSLKQARGLHKDPCDTNGACSEMELIKVEKEEDYAKYSKYFSKNPKTDRDYTPGETFTTSILYLVNAIDYATGDPLGKYCYIIYDLTETFYEYRYNVKNKSGDVEDFAILKNDISNFRSLIDDPACEKAAKERYETLISKDYQWDYDYVTEYTEDDDEEGDTGSTDTEVDEEEDREFTTSEAHGFKYKKKYALRSTSKTTTYEGTSNKVKEKDKWLYMYYANDYSKSGRIYTQSEDFNNNGITNYYMSRVSLSQSKKEIKTGDIPNDILDLYMSR
ncbi:hypothetical protein N9N67_07560 [Bacteriovoracaceae bacterium]|nr:hypothetical protein [Bacteriovoracaceae bacterium]